MRLAVDRLDSQVGTELTTTLLAELMDRYQSPDESDGLYADQLAPPHGTFLVAWDADCAVGCGGLRRIDDHVAEIKRMYVVPRARRRGIARTVLITLEDTARALGYGHLILETGTKQPEAIRLYETHGYEPMTPYGPYADSPMSRCFTKKLE